MPDLPSLTGMMPNLGLQPVCANCRSRQVFFLLRLYVFDKNTYSAKIMLPITLSFRSKNGKI